MLSIEDIKKIDPELAKMTDSELETLRADMYDAAQLAFDVRWLEKYGSKYPVGLLPHPDEDATL